MSRDEQKGEGRSCELWRTKSGCESCLGTKEKKVKEAIERIKHDMKGVSEEEWRNLSIRQLT